MAKVLEVSTSTFTRMEHGLYDISMGRLFQIAETLGVHWSSLLDNENPEIEYLEEQKRKVQEEIEACKQMIIMEHTKLIELHEKSK